MDADAPPAGITDTDWAATPPAVRAFIRACLLTVQFQQQQIAQLQQANAALQQRVADLEARLGQHSQNSSKPPSADPPNARPRPPKTARGRKAGGQKGHPRHERPDPSADHLDAVCEHYPDACPSCQEPLTDV